MDYERALQLARRAKRTDEQGKAFARTERGNGERFAAAFKDELIWVPEWGCWMGWDGRIWKRLYDETVFTFATAVVVEGLWGDVKRGVDENERGAMADWAEKCESHDRRGKMVKEARGLLVRSYDAFDRDEWLISTPTGTLDLRTCVLRAHDPADLISHIVTVPYDPSALAPTWERFLLQSMDGRQDFVDALARFAGYTLTGSVEEHSFFMLIGNGRNGKSTFIGILRKLLGEYAMTLSTNVVMVKDVSGGSAEELARLPGKRLAVISETPKGALNVPRMKELTGGDEISAKALYKSSFNFVPSAKFALHSNVRPNISEANEAIWARIKLVPFERQVPEDQRDKKLPEKLAAELPGIFAWAVRGLQDYLKNGLNWPKEWRAATRAYRADEDTQERFIRDWCEIGEGFTTTLSATFEAYQLWGRKTSSVTISKHEFDRWLKQRGGGVTDGRSGTRGRYWKGIRLNTEALAALHIPVEPGYSAATEAKPAAGDAGDELDPDFPSLPL